MDNKIGGYSYQLASMLKQAQAVTAQQMQGSQGRLDKAKIDATNSALESLQRGVESKKVTLETGTKINIYA